MPPPRSSSDGRDPAAEQSWLRRQARRMLGPGLRSVVDSQDVVQEVHLAVVREAGARSFADDRARRGWLYAVLKNKVAGLGRRRGTDQGAGAEWSALACNGSSPSAGLRRSESDADVMRRLERLSKRDAEVVRLRVVEDLAWSEVGRRLGIAEAHARVIFDRSVEKLRRSSSPDSDR